MCLNRFKRKSSDFRDEYHQHLINIFFSFTQSKYLTQGLFLFILFCVICSYFLLGGSDNKTTIKCRRKDVYKIGPTKGRLIQNLLRNYQYTNTYSYIPEQYTQELQLLLQTSYVSKQHINVSLLIYLNSMKHSGFSPAERFDLLKYTTDFNKIFTNRQCCSR